MKDRNRNRDEIIWTCESDLLYKIQMVIDGCVLKGFCSKDFDISNCRKENCYQCICDWLNKEKNEPPK